VNGTCEIVGALRGWLPLLLLYSLFYRQQQRMVLRLGCDTLVSATQTSIADCRPILFSSAIPLPAGLLPLNCSVA